jgi:hypothetical protein
LRKYLITAFVAAGLIAGGIFATSANAADSTACNGGEVPGVVNGTQSGTGGTLSVCIPAPSPIKGSLTGSGNTSGGNVSVDGDASNNSAHPCLDGFVGVKTNGAGAPTVASGSTGNYSPSSPPAAQPAIPPANPTNPLGCS